jgi:hypothetical protein
LLEPDNKILFDLEVGIDKHETNEKEIDRQEYARVIFDGRPGGFHFFTPMDIVEY